jgi:hypothetical protein
MGNGIDGWRCLFRRAFLIGRRRKSRTPQGPENGRVPGPSMTPTRTPDPASLLQREKDRKRGKPVRWCGVLPRTARRCARRGPERSRRLSLPLGLPPLRERRGLARSAMARAKMPSTGEAIRHPEQRPPPLRPFSRGRRTGRGDGQAPVTRVRDMVPHSISPLQERDAGLQCFMEGEHPPLAQRSGPRPLPGEGGTGRGDGQRDRRLVLSSFYPSQSPLSRGEAWGRARYFIEYEPTRSRRSSRTHGPSLERARPIGGDWIS